MVLRESNILRESNNERIQVMKLMKKIKIMLLIFGMIFVNIQPLDVKAENIASTVTGTVGVDVTRSWISPSDGGLFGAINVYVAGHRIVRWETDALLPNSASPEVLWQRLNAPNYSTTWPLNPELPLHMGVRVQSTYYATSTTPDVHGRWQIDYQIVKVTLSNIRFNTDVIAGPIEMEFRVNNIYEGNSLVDVELVDFASNGQEIEFGTQTTSYAPIINTVTPNPSSNTMPGYTAQAGKISALARDVQLTDSLTLQSFNDLLDVKSGSTNRPLTQVTTPSSEGYRLTNISGEPLNNGTNITGISKSVWAQRVTDFAGNSTEFERDVTIRTTNKPNIEILYDGGSLAGTRYTDGIANGGRNGWSNVPLRANVSTANGASHIVDGYYFNQLNDNKGGQAHGSSQKATAARRYEDNTDTSGINVTGVMVDAAKTTELSQRTDQVTLKIDQTSPNADATYNPATETLTNLSSDALSGLHSTQVAIVPAGSDAPAESVYRNFNEWKTFINKMEQYDIHVLATDNAGNKGTKVLSNQFLRGAFTNLEISKTVAGKYGSYHRPFEVSIFLQNEQGIMANGTYTVSSSLASVADTQVTFASGRAIVHVRHDETLTIKDLPEQHRFTVRETDVAIVDTNSPYTVSYNGETHAEGFSGQLSGVNASVAIRNVRESIPETGIGGDNNKLLMGSTLILLAFLVVTFAYCDKKRRYKR